MASEDLNALYNEARVFAEYMLLAHGEFIPFGVSMSPDGAITQVAGDLGTEHPDSVAMVELLQSSFAQSANLGSIRAAGVCLDTYVVPPEQQQSTDAICTRLAHVSGETVEVFVPYSRDTKGTFQLARPFAAAGGDFKLVEP
ncbi:hypothetical protein H0E84_15085 [Luteimonas sp. SJ-92]|uniref:Uncharacterized protein n=1 Tax=Luteimonas salinisoli TaxID=2752307 RepID=A0A853JG24_9GAMM|nr:hypothetical protein [Luteimonas salinisoli]NZA27704.1 hypothetical protein [Luteimonas salinisoli]